MSHETLRFPPGRPGREHVIGNLSPGEVTEDRSGPWLRRDGESSPASSPPPPPDAATEEHRLARALGALIQERGETRLPANATATLPPAVPGPQEPWWDLKPRPVTARSGGGFWLSFRRLLDLLGMSLAFLLFWVSYRAFLALPGTPTQSPWSLLGSARVQALATPPASQAAAPAKPLPPIGQFDFGQTVATTDTPPALPDLISHEPVELYRSIYELEDAFEAKYVPPAGCAGLATQAGVDITACINHRLSARRAFLASNGRTLEPDEPVRVRRPATPTEVPREEGWR